MNVPMKSTIAMQPAVQPNSITLCITSPRWLAITFVAVMLAGINIDALLIDAGEHPAGAALAQETAGIGQDQDNAGQDNTRRGADRPQEPDVPGIGTSVPGGTDESAEKRTLPTNPAELAEMLESQSVGDRWRAARRLGQLGASAEPAVSALVQALQDQNAGVRHNVVIALGSIGVANEEVLEALAEAIADPEPRIRLSAFSSLRRLTTDPAELVPIVSQLLQQQDQVIASRAVETVIQRGEKAVPVLIEALQNQRAAYWAALAIEEIGSPAAETVPALTKLLQSTDDQALKVQILLALASIGDEARSAEQEILTILSNQAASSDQAGPSNPPATFLHTAAAYAAGTLQLNSAVESLQTASRSNDEMLSMIAAWARARIEPENRERTGLAVKRLVQGLGSEDPAVRLSAAEGIQTLNVSPELVGPKLIELLRETDPVVSYNVVEAIASLGPGVAADVAGALDNPELRMLAARVIERLGTDAAEVVPQIVDALRGAEGEFRKALQMAIAEIGSEAAAATPPLIQSLDSDVESVRTTAMLALGKIGTAAEQSVDALQQTMQSSQDDFERFGAAWALVRVAPNDEQIIQSALPVLVHGLQFPDQMVQTEAASTLGKLGRSAASAVQPLAELANDETASVSVRQAAARALAKIKS